MKQAKITYEALGDTLLIHMPKELDHHNCRNLRYETDLLMAENYVSRIIFDFTRTRFMDSSGIAVVLRVKKRMEETDGDVFLLDPAPQCVRVLRTSGIERFVAIKFTEGKAAR